MKFFITTLFLTLFNLSGGYGQKSGFKEEIKKLFFNLPIDTNHSALLQSALSDTSVIIEKDSDRKFEGIFQSNPTFLLQPYYFRLSIDSSLEVTTIQMVAQYQNSHPFCGSYLYNIPPSSRAIEKQYKSLVKYFTHLTPNKERWVPQYEHGWARVSNGVYYTGNSFSFSILLENNYIIIYYFVVQPKT